MGKLEDHVLFHCEQQFYKIDPISKKYAICVGGQEIPSTRTECLNLERAAVWDKVHVENRLLAISEGKECKWTVSLHADK